MFFALSKIAWFLLNPANLFVLAAALGAAAMLVGLRRAAWALFSLALTVFVAFGVLPTDDILVAHLEDRYPAPETLPQAVSGIVVLGGVVNAPLSAARGQVQIGAATERLFAAADLAERYPDAPVIYSGGSGSLIETDAREADLVTALFKRLGLAESRVILERNARNTHENAVFAARAAPPSAAIDDPEKPWILVTSARHMPRAMGVFEAQGWRVLAYPVDYATEGGDQEFAPIRGTVRPTGQGVYEFLGLLAYRLTGRTAVLYPGPET
jgi:uncharacterized SAM-binding protein YcdF (DUF218 family)